MTLSFLLSRILDTLASVRCWVRRIWNHYIISCHHNVCAIQILDHLERCFPIVGLLGSSSSRPRTTDKADQAQRIRLLDLYHSGKSSWVRLPSISIMLMHQSRSQPSVSHVLAFCYTPSGSFARIVGHLLGAWCFLHMSYDLKPVLKKRCWFRNHQGQGILSIVGGSMGGLGAPLSTLSPSVAEIFMTVGAHTRSASL